MTAALVDDLRPAPLEECRSGRGAATSTPAPEAATRRLRVVPTLAPAAHDLAAQADPAACIDRLTDLQAAPCSAEAAQHVAMLALDGARHEEREAAGLPTDRRLSAPGVAAELGAALGCSAAAAARRLGLARVAVRELPRMHGLHRDGRVSEDHVCAVAAATACLSREDRGWVDEIDPHAAVAQHEHAVRERHVSTRPVAGGMLRLSALLPLVEGVSCWAALSAEAQSLKAMGGEERTLGQIRADLLVERVTGHRSGQVPVEVALVMSDVTLFGNDGNDAAVPAWVPGYGPVPA